MPASILVTGGSGYIGSHIVLLLLEAGFDVTVLDNFSTSSSQAIARVSDVTTKKPRVLQADLRELSSLADTFSDGAFDAVIHLAGLKSVSESVADPIVYYDNNVRGTVNLLKVMTEAGVRRLIFSSSATVYGVPTSLPLTEHSPRSATNPYGRTKLMIEDILEDLFLADQSWSMARLRYFNPVGAHSSGHIGEDPNGVPSNLMPYLCQVAVGRHGSLCVFGKDYSTPDGTGVRDYIHVMDLAAGHLAALKRLLSGAGGAFLTANLGTGRGYSVLELVNAFEKCSGRKIRCKFLPRRQGDVATCFADPSLAKLLFNWSATRGIYEMCADAWRWQLMNPNGYSKTGG